MAHDAICTLLAGTPPCSAARPVGARRPVYNADSATYRSGPPERLVGAPFHNNGCRIMMHATHLAHKPRAQRAGRRAGAARAGRLMPQLSCSLELQTATAIMPSYHIVWPCICNLYLREGAPTPAPPRRPCRQTPAVPSSRPRRQQGQPPNIRSPRQAGAPRGERGQAGLLLPPPPPPPLQPGAAAQHPASSGSSSGAAA